MKILGFNITRAAPAPAPTIPLSHDRGRWWWPIISEPYTGAWQRNEEIRVESIVTYFAVYSCISLIAQDIGKLRIKLMVQNAAGIWQEVEVPAFSPVLRKPNHFQTRGQFIEQWIASKLIDGNTYILKERDNRGIVVRLYVLDPLRTQVLVAPNGDIYYDLAADNLAGIEQAVRVPASEIIHDVMLPIYGHALCGVSPLAAAFLPVSQGLSIQRASSKFFTNGSRPGGILTSPHIIDQEFADRLKNEWETKFAGDASGKIAVLGDGLTYTSLGIPAEQAQLIEQLKWTAENVCAVFHVPPHMLGIGTPPNVGNSVEALTQLYYAQALQHHVERIEALLDEGLALPKTYGTEFDVQEGLLRMDTATLVKTTADSVGAGFLTPNEARAKFGLAAKPGGNSLYLQQQYWPLEAPRVPAATPPPAPPPAEDDSEDEGDPPPDESERRYEQLDADRIYAIAKSLI